MEIHAENKVRPGPTVNVEVLAYSEPNFQHALSILKSAHFENLLTIRRHPAAENNGQGPLCVIAFFQEGDSIETYLQDLARLKVVLKVPVIISVVGERFRTVVESRKKEIASDEILYLPVAPRELSKTILTWVVSAKIEKKGKEGAQRQSLGEILVANGIVSPLELKKALDFQKSTRSLLGNALVALGLITDEQKTHFLASQLGVAMAKPKEFASAEIQVVALIPERTARQYACIALKKEDDVLTVAMTDVADLRLLDHLRDQTELTINPVLGTRDEISASIGRYYREISAHKDATDLIADLQEDVEVLDTKEEAVNLEAAAAAGAEAGIVRLVNFLIVNAVKDRASDIHIEPMEHTLIIRYRVDGDLRVAMSPPKTSHQAIIARIKIMSNLDIAERRIPQDGRLAMKVGRREIDVRVSILPSIFGEKAVLRILDKEAFEKSVSNLGFSEKDTAIFQSQIEKPYGMIIATGPTGSGKSTTLYSAIQRVKSTLRNIVTVEDPVEFHMEGVTQVNVNKKTNLTFAAALRAILRQDPDIILIGEIRDEETADIAIKMALTGHLVFSTLHTNDAVSTIARFTDIGVPPLLLGSSLNLVVAQRLVRKICTKCKVEYDPPEEVLKVVNLKAGSAARFFRGEGCVSCNGSGFLGRIGIFEMMPVSKDIRKLIVKNASSLELQEQAETEGMITLRKSGIELVLKGETTLEEVIAATTEL